MATKIEQMEQIKELVKIRSKIDELKKEEVALTEKVKAFVRKVEKGEISIEGWVARLIIKQSRRVGWKKEFIKVTSEEEAEKIIDKTAPFVTETLIVEKEK